MNELEQLAEKIVKDMYPHWVDSHPLRDAKVNYILAALQSVANKTERETWELAAEISNDHQAAMIAVRQPNKRVMKWIPMRNLTEIFRAKAAALNTQDVSALSDKGE